MLVRRAFSKGLREMQKKATLEGQLEQVKRAFLDSRTKQQLRDQIRFSEILSRAEPIKLYDDRGKPFRNYVLVTLLIGALAGAVWCQAKKRKSTLLQVVAVSLVAMRLVKFFNFRSVYVGRILYEPTTQTLVLGRRGLLGFAREQRVSRFRVLYTEDQVLRLRGINYINMDTLKGYSIAVRQAWLDEALFSYLIGQRISTGQ